MAQRTNTTAPAYTPASSESHPVLLIVTLSEPCPFFTWRVGMTHNRCCVAAVIFPVQIFVVVACLLVRRGFNSEHAVLPKAHQYIIDLRCAPLLRQNQTRPPPDAREILSEWALLSTSFHLALQLTVLGNRARDFLHQSSNAPPPLLCNSEFSQPSMVISLIFQVFVSKFVIAQHGHWTSRWKLHSRNCTAWASDVQVEIAQGWGINP